jgi:hypothetical protein
VDSVDTRSCHRRRPRGEKSPRDDFDKRMLSCNWPTRGLFAQKVCWPRRSRQGLTVTGVAPRWRADSRLGARRGVAAKERASQLGVRQGTVYIYTEL